MTDFEKKYIEVCNRLKKYVVPYRTNIEKIRIGNLHDGGYVIGKLDNYDFLYSYGSNDMISFENTIHDMYKTHSYVYDNSIDKITNKPDNITFFKENVGSSKTYNADTIDNHIIRNGDTERKNLLMQIDIEGAEWHLFPECKYLTNFSQIVIEFHVFFDITRHDDIIDSTFKKLNEDFTCIHVHGTNAPLRPWLDGNFPVVFEVAYIRNDLITYKELETSAYPVKGLDFPTDPTRPDLNLTYWLG